MARYSLGSGRMNSYSSDLETDTLERRFRGAPGLPSNTSSLSFIFSDSPYYIDTCSAKLQRSCFIKCEIKLSKYVERMFTSHKQITDLLSLRIHHKIIREETIRTLQLKVCSRQPDRHQSPAHCLVHQRQGRQDLAQI